MRRFVYLALLLCVTTFISCDKETFIPSLEENSINTKAGERYKKGSRQRTSGGQRMGKGELYERLSAIECISDIKAVDNERYHTDAFNEEYQFYIEQLIDPNNPDVGTFKQKIRIGHISFDSPTVLVTEGYAVLDKDSATICYYSRYDETQLASKKGFKQGEEIARHLKANMIVVEHRYFYSSNPDPRLWEYLTTSNACADLHKIHQTLRPIYERPWVSTGVSKGGMTTMYYHMMYPNDVDICVPYVAPMCYGLNDDRARDYIKELAGDEDIRKKIVECKNWLLNYMNNNNNLDALCNEHRRQWQNNETNSIILGKYLNLIIDFDVRAWNYGNNWLIDIMPIQEKYQNPKWIVNWFAKITLVKDKKIKRYSRTKFQYEFINPAAFYNKVKTRATFYDALTSGIKHKNSPYYYMAARELGYVETRGINDLKIPKESWRQYMEKVINHNTESSMLSIYNFANSTPPVPNYSPALYEQCISYYQQHDDRVIFIYGANDFWTGCGINDVWKDARNDRNKYPTFDFDKNKNMACYIVPNHGHESLILHLPVEKQQEIWGKIDQWILERWEKDGSN